MKNDNPIVLPVHLTSSHEMIGYYEAIQRANILLLEQLCLIVREWKRENPLFPPFTAWVGDEDPEIGLKGPSQKQLSQEDQKNFTTMTGVLIHAATANYNETSGFLNQFFNELNASRWSNECIDDAIENALSESIPMEAVHSFLAHLQKNDLQHQTTSLIRPQKGPRL